MVKLTQENPPKNFDPPILMIQQCIVVKFWLKNKLLFSYSGTGASQANPVFRDYLPFCQLQSQPCANTHWHVSWIKKGVGPSWPLKCLVLFIAILL